MKSVVSERGQVVIPKRLRDRLGIRPGQALDFQEERGRLVATKLETRDPVAGVYGILPGDGSSDALIAELRGEADAVAAAPPRRKRRRDAPGATRQRVRKPRP